jgi:hypothetical protein
MSAKAEVNDALELARSILDDVEEVPEEGEDFAAGIQETTEGIMETIEEKDFVTPNQLRALVNMRNGLNRWLRSY